MRSVLWTALVAGVLAACGGGGNGGGLLQPSPTPPTSPAPSPTPTSAPTPSPSPDPVATGLRISGALRPSGDAAVDSDTADPSVPPVTNGGTEVAQPLRNPVTLGGHASELNDPFDVFSVELAGGQVIRLFIAEDGAANDLDLVLGDADGQLIDGSLGTGKFESLTVPGDGTARYFIQIEAFSGASNYVLSVSQADAQAEPAGAMSTQAEMVAGQALVDFDETVPQAKAMGEATQARIPGGAALLDVSTMAKSGMPASATGLQVTDAALAERLATLRIIKDLRRQPGVRHAEPNLIRRAAAEPDDAFYPQQWHYPLINLPQAWDITTGSPNVLVAVADTGVRLAHPDLQDQFDPLDPNGFDFIRDIGIALDGDGLDGDANDPGDGGINGISSFHGTHVAGTVAAATNNQIGVAGVAWNARIMPLRVLGEGGTGSSFDIQNAVLYAAGRPNATGQLPPRPADIINLSLGGDGSSQSEQAVYREARDAGLIIIASAGNGGDARLSFPASYDGVVSVAAVGRQKQRAPYSQFNAEIDVAAPGGDASRGSADGVLSTRASDATLPIRDTVSFLQGTSMAAPHVAGVVALMKAVNPDLTPQTLDTLLASGSITEDLGAAGRDNQFGHGLINANLAVRQAITLGSGAPPADNPRLAANPTTLDFGSSAAQRTLDLGNAGTGDLNVTGVSDDAPWLTVVAGSVDASTGLGRYTVSVNREGLADGTYAATLTAGSSANVVEIPVLMRVGLSAGQVDAGKQYVLLVDAETDAVVAQDEVLAQNGTYDYRFDDVPPGTYLIISGSDSDNDGLICDDGESCGAFPNLDQPEAVRVFDADQTGIDFGLGFDLSTPTGAQSADGAATDRALPRRHRSSSGTP